MFFDKGVTKLLESNKGFRDWYGSNRSEYEKGLVIDVRFSTYIINRPDVSKSDLGYMILWAQAWCRTYETGYGALKRDIDILAGRLGVTEEERELLAIASKI